MTSRYATLVPRLAWLASAAAAVPLAALLVLAFRSRQVESGFEYLGETLLAAAAGAVTLAALVWLIARPIWSSLGRSLEGLREPMTSALDGNYGARAAVNGPGSEVGALEGALNDLLEAQQRRVLNLRLEREQAAALRKSSLQLIRECIYAREPLAKRHPDLAAAYAAAVVRQAAKDGEDGNRSADGLVHGVESIPHSGGQREAIRWTPKNVRIEVPMPSTLLNMSASGMAVESDRGLSVGGSWVFRIGNETRIFDIPGKICWCHLARTDRVNGDVRPVFHTGVEFEGPLPGRVFDFFSSSFPERPPSERATG